MDDDWSGGPVRWRRCCKHAVTIPVEAACTGGQQRAVMDRCARRPMNTPRPKPFAGKAERLAAAAGGCIPIRSASFVSVLVEADQVRRRGLPQADFFLWNDDFEFTARLLRDGTVLCPASTVSTTRPRTSVRRTGGQVLLRGRTNLDAQDGFAGTAGAGPLRGRDASAVDPYLRALDRPGACSAQRSAGESLPACGRARGRPSRCWRRPAWRPTTTPTDRPDRSRRCPLAFASAGRLGG